MEYEKVLRGGQLDVHSYIWDAGTLSWIPATGGAGSGSVEVTNFPASYPVTGTFWQATQPVSGPLTDVELRATDVKITLDGEIPVVDPKPYTVMIEEATAVYTYVGEALAGTAIGTSEWRIKRIDTSSGVVIAWADGVSTFTKAWSSRASYTYS